MVINHLLTGMTQKPFIYLDPLTHSIHVWYIYLHLPQKSTIHVGKHTVRPMDGMGKVTKHFTYLKWRYSPIYPIYKLYGYGLCKGNPSPKIAEKLGSGNPPFQVPEILGDKWLTTMVSKTPKWGYSPC